MYKPNESLAQKMSEPSALKLARSNCKLKRSLTVWLIVFTVLFLVVSGIVALVFTATNNWTPVAYVLAILLLLLGLGSAGFAIGTLWNLCGILEHGDWTARPTEAATAVPQPYRGGGGGAQAGAYGGGGGAGYGTGY